MLIVCAKVLRDDLIIPSPVYVGTNPRPPIPVQCSFKKRTNLMIIYSPLKTEDEDGRLDALRRYNVLDSDPEESFDDIVRLLCRIFDVRIAAISFIDEKRQWFKAILGDDAKETLRTDAFCNHTIGFAEPMSISDASRDPRFAENPYVLSDPGIRCYLGAPLTTPDGYNVGSICIMGTEPRTFSAAEGDILKGFASIIVTQLELSLAVRRDSLTGCFSRGAFEGLLRDAADAKRDHGRPATLALLDIDHFKSINDRFGHPVGDTVLQALTAVTQSTLRRSDQFGRLGGEEFGILMHNVELDAANLIVERVREAIEMLSLPQLGGLGVTASFGLAEFGPQHTRIVDWIKAADIALYHAKHEGRNCVKQAA